jgi:CTP:molybdopterin cytidylyltransferase MocA
VALVGALLRLRTLDQTLAAIGRKLGIEIRKVELKNPLAAVDVDKPSDHELVTAILDGRL